MSEALALTSALLRSRLVSSASSDPLLVDAWERGLIENKPARIHFRAAAAAIRGLEPHGTKRRQIRAYDRAKTWGRKRQMGGDGKMPNTIRCWFTEGERAVLSVISAEVKKHGECKLPILTIARRAGVGVRLVQYTLALARGGRARPCRRSEPSARPVLISVAYRRERGRAFNETNVITIVSREWLLWLNYRPSENPDTGCTEVRPNSIHNLIPLSLFENRQTNGRDERSQGAYEAERAPPAEAPTGRARVRA